MEEKKLTDEEIVKALEFCVKNDCEKCPYLIKGFDCVISKQAENDFLDLIHRLQDDYSNLKERYVKVLDLNEKVIAEQKTEIERLTEENGYLDGCAKQFLADYQKCEIENAEIQKQVDELKQINAKIIVGKDEMKEKYESDLKYYEDLVISEKEGAFWDGVNEGKNKAEKDTAKEIFEKIFEVLCCFTTQGKSKEYAEGFIDCLEEVDKRLQNLAKEQYGVEVE